MAVVSLLIPVIPTGKGRPRLTTQGGFAHTYTPPKTRQAEDEIRTHLNRLWHGKPLEGQISMDVTFFMSIAKSTSRKRANAMIGKPHSSKPDLDNLLKLLCDALNGIVFKDDSQIWNLTSEKQYHSYPRIEVSIEETDL